MLAEEGGSEVIGTGLSPDGPRLPSLGEVDLSSLKKSFLST